MGSTRVLVVDDDAESRELVAEVLVANGYVVDSVENAAAARAAVDQDGAYNVVIADVKMPKETGLELMRNLRQHNFKQSIILMSSFMTGRERELAEQMGAEALLEKPFRLTELLRAVEEAVAKQTQELGLAN